MRTDIEGQIAAYAAAPGQVASDGLPGENSPYTRQMLKELSNRDASLITACSKANQTVNRTSTTHQRPFLSTDMNGDIYLQRQPESRKRIAIIVSQDKLLVGDPLANVERDARDWKRFLERKCGFKTVLLKNPDRDTFKNSFKNISFPSEKPSVRSRVSGGSEPDSTLLMFVYAGMGVSVKGLKYLMASDTHITSVDNVAKQTVPLTEIQDSMRKKANASILILDTNFAILDEPKSR